MEEEGLINHRYYNRMLPDSDKFSHDRTLFEKEIRKLEGQYKLVLHPAKTSDEMKMTGGPLVATLGGIVNPDKLGHQIN